MSKNEKDENLDETTKSQFEEMLDGSLMKLRNGEVVKGTIVRVTNTEAIVDLGYKSDGIVTKSEFTDDTSVVLTEIAKPGDVIDVFIVRVNDGEGNVIVSKKKVDYQNNIKVLEQAFEDKTPVPGKITEIVKGGLVANVLGSRAFIPASQISNRFEQDLDVFKGKEFKFEILEFDRSKRRIVAGRKELATKEADQKRKEIFENIQVGQKIEGTVIRIVDFGAFVDLGGIDGLIHVSEVSWKRVRKPSDVLKIGDVVNATVVAFDPEKDKISLSLKDEESNPWANIIDKYPIGEIVVGKVARLATFGAFVTLEDGVDGLVHISQISHRRINKPEEVLSPGQVIHVKVMNIDLENSKISLSKREADEIMNPPEEEPKAAKESKSEPTSEVKAETEPEATALEAEPENEAENAPESVSEAEPTEEEAPTEA